MEFSESDYGPCRAAFQEGRQTFAGTVIGGSYRGCFIHVGTWAYRKIPLLKLGPLMFGGYFVDFSGKPNKPEVDNYEFTIDTFEEMDEFLRIHPVVWACPTKLDEFTKEHLPHLWKRVPRCW